MDRANGLWHEHLRNLHPSLQPWQWHSRHQRCARAVGCTTANQIRNAMRVSGVQDARVITLASTVGANQIQTTKDKEKTPRPIVITTIPCDGEPKAQYPWERRSCFYHTRLLIRTMPTRATTCQQRRGEGSNGCGDGAVQWGGGVQREPLIRTRIFRVTNAAKTRRATAVERGGQKKRRGGTSGECRMQGAPRHGTALLTLDRQRRQPLVQVHTTETNKRRPQRVVANQAQQSRFSDRWELDSPPPANLRHARAATTTHRR